MGTHAADPLGPDSLVWRLGFARTSLLFAGRALVMQVAHPVVGAGVRDFSEFRADPWGRLDRTVGSLLTQLFGGADAHAEADRLRAMHREIAGTGFDGGPYCALAPDAWAWVHLANADTALRYTERMVRPLRPDERERLYRDWRQVGLVLGIADDDMPPDVAGLNAYVDRVVAERLVANPSCSDVLDAMRLDGVGPPARAVPRPVWAALRPLGGALLHETTVGTLPPALRDKLGVRWTARQEARLQRVLTAVRVATWAVPPRVLHYPVAYRARRAAG